MSNDSSKHPEQPVIEESSRVAWYPWVAVVFVIVVFYVSQIIGGALISIYPALKHWTSGQANSWLSDSAVAQFVFVLLVELISLGAIYWFLRRYRTDFSAIGLHRPKGRDFAYGLIAVPLYYVLFLLVVSVISHFVPSLNINQEQEIGFTNVHGLFQLSLTFISLAVLPPITEEIMVRGFLYTSLKSTMPKLGAVVMTSAIFAAAHLPEGGASGPLYIAAIDTFILSLVLIYLREKTGSLWASITLHSIKNSVAFFALFVFVSH